MSQLLHNKDAEIWTLSAMLYDQATFIELSAIVSAEMFYTTRHQEAFIAIKGIYNAGKLPDVPDMVEAGIDDALMAELIECEGITKLSCRQWAWLVRELWMRRRMIVIAHDAMQSAKNKANEIDEVIETFLEAIKIRESFGDRAVLSREEVRVQVERELVQAFETKKMPGWRTGNARFDHNSLGYFPGALSVVAARTGEGKTFFAWQRCVDFKRENGLAAGIVSGEMDGPELVMRQVVTDKALGEASKGELERHELDAAKARLAAYAADGPEIARMVKMTIPSVREAVTELALRKKCKLIFIDFVQMIRTDIQDPNEAMLEIISQFKTLAARLEVQLVCLSQLTKEGRREYQPSVGEDRLYGGSALSWYCHTISVLFRARNLPPDRIAKIGNACSLFRIDPNDVTLERIVKGRRGVPTYLTGSYTLHGEHRSLPDSLADEIRKVL